MPWFSCRSGKSRKFVVAQSRRQAEYFSRYHLGLGSDAECEPVEMPGLGPGNRRKVGVRAR